MRRIGRFFLALLTTAAMLDTGAQAAEPSAEPILRIETGMHTAPIRRIDVDRADRLALTASDDKTARLWSLPDGRLLRVLRPPLGAGDEGKLFAAALSPDGKLAAVGGSTGDEWDGDTISVYLFDTATGKMVRRIAGLENTVQELEFSPDGRHLAAGLGLGGVRVWDTANYREVLADKEYAAGVYGISFAKAGWMAAASQDGYVRIYGKDMKFERKFHGLCGMELYGLTVNQKNSNLSVNCMDGKGSSVFNDKAVYFFSDQNIGERGALVATSWSRSGKFLFASGESQFGAFGNIYRWKDLDKKNVRYLPAAEQTVLDLKPFGDDGVIFASALPSWGAFNGAGKNVIERVSAAIDFRGSLGDALMVSSDGARVRFGSKVIRTQMHLFDLGARALSDAPSPPADLAAPRISGLKISDWENQETPALDGARLPLSKSERARGLALSPSADRFLLGTEWHLRLFDKTGKQLWEKPAPGVVWGVNISGDGRLAVAANGDGTIRWRRMSDGQELLALFVHAQDKSWVAWTPKGYYMASPGGENLIGWHVNNAKDAAADFFGVGRFRDAFNRPDVVERVLATLDETEALRQADAAGNRRRQEAEDIRRKLPPVVEILSPSSGATFSGQSATLRYRVRSPSGLPVTRVRTLIDGQSPAEAARGLGRVADGGGEYTVDVALPPRNVTVGLVAETEHGAGEVAAVALKWAGGNVADLTKPKLYAVLVGTAAYSNPKVSPLRWAAQDARDMADALLKQKGALYRDVEVKVLDDRDKDEVLDGLEWLQRAVTSRDVGLLFLSGHGHNDNYGDYWYLPRGADPDALRRTALRSSEFKEVLSKLPGKAVLLVDTCHAAQVGAERTRSAVDVNRFVSELSSADAGVVTFTSSTGKQLSVERDEWRNGAFTKALKEAFGEFLADLDDNGALTLAELDHYLAERVKELTQGRQSPVMLKADAVPNIPIAARPR